MRRCVLVASSVCLVVACGGGDAPAVQPKLSDIQSKIFSVSCTFSSCHSEAGRKGGLVLTPGRARAQLVGVDAENAAARALGKKRVVAGQAAASFLYQKVAGTGLTLCNDAQTASPTQCNEGFLMPGANEKLPATHLSAIQQWIAGGALDD